MQKVREIIQNKKVRKVLFFISVLLMAVLLNSDLGETMMGFSPYLLAFSLTILILLLWSIAGVVIFKALFEIAASLTFLIFLTQSFCAVETTTDLSKEALRSLFWFGMVFILVRFVWLIWTHLFGDKKSKSEKIHGIFNDPEVPTPLFIPFAIGVFLPLFGQLLFLVIYPIVENTCVL